MPWLSEATKDVTSCDKLRGVANTPRSADFRMGQPNISDDITMQSMGQTRGTETSHYPEEKKTIVITQVVASERVGAQTGVVTAMTGVVGPPINLRLIDSGIFWKGKSQRVITPYTKSIKLKRRHLSSAEHEKFCVNQRGPSRKAKYYRKTDSEPVP